MLHIDNDLLFIEQSALFKHYLHVKVLALHLLNKGSVHYVLLLHFSHFPLTHALFPVSEQSSSFWHSLQWPF